VILHAGMKALELESQQARAPAREMRCKLRCAGQSFCASCFRLVFVVACSLTD
jgi:hypothetical protein